MIEIPRDQPVVASDTAYFAVGLKPLPMVTPKLLMTPAKTGLQWIGFLLGLFLTGLYAFGHYIDGDVLQMLCKADTLASKGVLIPFGSVSSSGASGNIPGPFLTLISGLPMKIWYSPWSALIALTLLHAAAFWLYRSTLKHFLSIWSVSILIIFFWLNPWRMSEVFLWNPGYIIIPSCLHLWSAFHLSQKRSFSFSVLHALSLFLGLQTHPSFVILGLITLGLFWTKAMKPHFWGTVFGVLLGVASLSPYLIWGLKDPSVFPQAGGEGAKGHLFYGLTHVYPVVKAFWYWILYASNIFQTHVFHQVRFDWIGSVTLTHAASVMWAVFKYTMGTLGVLVAFFANYKFYKNHKEKFRIYKYKMRDSRDWLCVYTILSLISALIAAAIAPTVPIYWHLLFVWPAALVPALLQLEDWYRIPSKRLKVQRYLGLVAGYFIATNLFAAVLSRKHDITQPFHTLYYESYQNQCGLNSK